MRRLLLFILIVLGTSFAASGSHAIDWVTLRWVRSKPAIDSILITGNRFFKASDIKKRMYSRKRSFWRTIKGDRRTKIQRETLGRDTLEIKYLYLSNGFLGIQVKETFEILPEDSTALVRVDIREGKRFYYGNKKITGSFEKRFTSDFQKIASRFRYGKPINLFDLHDATFNMKTILANEGYPYAKVSFSLDTNKIEPFADVTFAINSDSLVHFGEVIIEGIQRFPEYVARRELRIIPGHIYRRNDILDSQRRLMESGYFRTFHISRAETITDRLKPDFVVRVRERKPTYLTLRTGIGQSEVRDLIWDFTAGFGKRNFLGSRRYDLQTQFTFGTDRTLRLLGHNYQLRFTEPWLFGLRMPLSLTGKYEPGVKDPVQNYRIETWSVSASTMKNFGSEIKTSLGLEYIKVNIFGIPDDQVELKKQENGISVRRKIYFSFRRDSRDNPFIPRRGSVTEFSFDYFGGFLGGDEHFYKWHTSWSSYQVVWPGWISATRLRFEHAKPFGASEIVPVNDLFYMGGANTVRGFKENTLGPTWDDGTPRGANFTCVFNQEFRWKTLQIFRPIPLLKDLFRSFPLWQSIFFDIGNGFLHTKDFTFSSLAYTYGTGIQIMSPAGPIRIDYARRIKTKKIDFDDRWHFTILYAF